MTAAVIPPAERLANRIVSVSDGELARRRRGVWEAVTHRGGDLFVGFDSSTVRYLTGYNPTTAERPFAVLLDDHGQLTLLVPLLKEADARASARCDRLLVYDEYPGRTHPMTVLARHIAGGTAKTVVAETDGYANPHGYHGPVLSSLLDRKVVVDRRTVQALRMVKADEEIALLRHASDWSLHAHWLLQDTVGVCRHGW